MKNEKLYDAITDIRDETIARAQKHSFEKPGRGKKRWWSAAVAAVLVVACVAGVVFWPGGSAARTPAYAISQAQYPQMAPYPDESAFWEADTGEFDHEAFSEAHDAWQESLLTQQPPEGYADGLDAFFSASIRQFLSGSDGENRVYSPLSVYMALAMLAELTDHNSRQQVLDVLGSESMEALRQQACDVWNGSYRNDGALTSILASSLWLNEQVDFEQPAMDTLAEIYYASSYRGEMGSDAFNQALRDWINTQTGGLLADQVSDIGLDAATILALVTTVYFRAKWSAEFSPDQTRAGVFHAADGDVTCDFMHQTSSKAYYWGDRFSAVGQRLESGGSMWFLLPDEGVSVDDLLDDAQAMAFLLADGQWENQTYLRVNQSIPKFDVASRMNLEQGLQALGITDVFDPEVSDFTPMTKQADGVFLSRAQHGARVVIDEEGCTAAAYTVLQYAGATAPPEEEVDFVLDRPFLFAITGNDGLPLFVGVVYQPA